MHIVYVDESGDTGPRPRGASPIYALGSIAVPGARWNAVLDEFVAFRRHLEVRFGVPMRTEIKAAWLLHGSGELRSLSLSPGTRRAIYELHLKLLAWTGLGAFAVVLHKPADRYPQVDPSQLAWMTLFQRLEAFAARREGPLSVVHEEGDNARIRKHARQRTRYGLSGGVYGGHSHPEDARIIEDPHPKRSGESYFVQFADLVAYASAAAVRPPDGSANKVVDERTYALLGDARLVEVTGLRPRHAERSIVLRDDL